MENIYHSCGKNNKTPLPAVATVAGLSRSFLGVRGGPVQGPGRWQGINPWPAPKQNLKSSLTPVQPSRSLSYLTLLRGGLTAGRFLFTRTGDSKQPERSGPKPLIQIRTFAMRSHTTNFASPKTTRIRVPELKVDEFAKYFEKKSEHSDFKLASKDFVGKVRGGSLDLAKKADLELAGTVIKTGHQLGRETVFPAVREWMPTHPEIGPELKKLLIRCGQLDAEFIPLLETTKQLEKLDFLNPNMLKGKLQAACSESRAGKLLVVDLGDKYKGSEGGAPRAGDLQHILGDYHLANGAALVRRIMHEVTAPSIVLTDSDGSQGPRFAEDGLALDREPELRSFCGNNGVEKFYQATRNGKEALAIYPGTVVHSLLDLYVDVDVRSSAGRAVLGSYTRVLRRALERPMANYCAEPGPKNPVSVILTDRHGLGRTLITSSDRSILGLLCFDSIPPGF